MTEYKIGPATVRMHGKPDQKTLEAAADKYMNAIVQQRRKAKKERSEDNGQDYERKTAV